MPDVSVIIPTFNRARLICSAVRSALNQAHCSVEVIVVDDGSTDDTSGELEASFQELFHDESEVPSLTVVCDDLPRVRYFWQANAGVNVANNTGLGMCQGEYIKFLDSDDELLPDTLYQELAVARERQLDVLCTGFEERTYDGGKESLELRIVNPAPRLDAGIDDLLTGQSAWTSAALYRSRFVANLQWPEHVCFANDWGWVWTVGLAGAKFGSLDIQSAIYKHHNSERLTNASSSFDQSVTARTQILEMVLASLTEQDLLTATRRHALAQYFYKDALTLRERDRRLLRALCSRCEQLVPGFKPVVYNPRLEPFVWCFGPYWGADVYVRSKRFANRNPFMLPPVRWLFRVLRRDYPVGG